MSMFKISGDETQFLVEFEDGHRYSLEPLSELSWFLEAGKPVYRYPHDPFREMPRYDQATLTIKGRVTELNRPDPGPYVDEKGTWLH